MQRDEPLLAEDAIWAEESASRIAAAWKLSPPLPQISGDDLVRALLHCGWFAHEQSEQECHLTREDQTIIVPRHSSLHPAIVAALSMEANVGPLTLIAALEKTILPAVHGSGPRPVVGR